MLFNSTVFAIFLPLVLGAYWLLRRRLGAQNVLLLAAGLLFYGWWDVRFLYLFILTTGVDYYCALMIGRGRVAPRQRLIVSAGLVGSAVVCLVIPWGALHIARLGLHFSTHVDRHAAATMMRQGLTVLAATAAIVTSLNLANPLLTRLPEERRRRIFMAASVVSNLCVLGFFKYYDFFAANFAAAIHGVTGVQVSSFTLNVILPAGISFYTFQSLAYTVEVFRRKVEPVERYVTLASYLSFFPLLVAGPIERPTHLLPQFLRPRTTNRDMWRQGAWLICWGLFKKMVVADNMARIVGDVFGPYDHLAGTAAIPHDGLRLLLGIYAFALQIYGDFSGYTDIARGVSKLFGFDVMLNFNLPYAALSPSDFWRRWHISLSTWLRDYLYIPLGGSRGGVYLTYRNLLLTMLLGGLWHGASWTFVLWGAYHGALLIVYRLLDLRPEDRNYPRWANVILWLVMLHLTCLGWLLFRAKNLTTISVFLQSILLHPHGSPEALAALKSLVFFGWLLLLFQVVQYAMKTLDPMARWHWFIRLNVWIFVVMSLLALASTQGTEFIYFAF
ncbi:MAG TPA: MBOAT family O-acyltransferase [Tepidisphaeraceae bacterium]|jgi:D-alanyl-lipoteichoic acid acyltransferase DltB (MBOAT superfamily)|nr:MBOAT family O-acyltransferase [Tepidisphaeraceae bacterium]